MKAKYKLGQFIQTAETTEVPALTGVIDTVILRTEGVSYTVKGTEDEITEEEVAAVFRPVTPRRPKLATAKPSKKTAKAA